MILLAEGIHNFVGGIAIGGAFVAGVETGLVTWFASAAHEIPQELGDFAVLVHSGWSRRSALLLNLASGLTFLVGSLLTYAMSYVADVAWLVPFAAGNFLYLGASDLVPEIKVFVYREGEAIEEVLEAEKVETEEAPIAEITEEVPIAEETTEEEPAEEETLAAEEAPETDEE